MNTNSKRIMHLITQATQAIEQGQLHVRLPDVSNANSLSGTGLASATLTADGVLPLTQTGAARRGEAIGTEPEMSDVCVAFNRMADAICRRDRERLHLMAMAAHDLSTPLMVISSAARMLGESDVPLSERRECLARLQRNVVALQYIVAELNDKVQAQAGQLHLNFEETDLTALARKVAADFSASVSSHPICFEGEGACPILADQQRLSRMLLNLLSNAVKYSEAGSEVTVSVWQRGAQALLSVQDRGVGVPPSETERIFLPFKRLDRTSSMADGSGMGLASVQKIAEAHGAEIRVQGAPRQGTIVEIAFKLLAERASR
jgi:signal transduction histidine kinase